MRKEDTTYHCVSVLQLEVTRRVQKLQPRMLLQYSLHKGLEVVFVQETLVTIQTACHLEERIIRIFWVYTRGHISHHSTPCDITRASILQRSVTLLMFLLQSAFLLFNLVEDGRG